MCIERGFAKGLRSPAHFWAVLGPTFHLLRNSLYPLALPPVMPPLQRFPGRVATHKSNLSVDRVSPTSLQPLKADARVGMYGHTPRACVCMDPYMHIHPCACCGHVLHACLPVHVHSRVCGTHVDLCVLHVSVCSQAELCLLSTQKKRVNAGTFPSCLRPSSP